MSSIQQELQRCAVLTCRLQFEDVGTLPKKGQVVFLRNRQGFIKFALKNGLTLVPVYGFGENQVLFLLHCAPQASLLNNGVQTFKRYTSLKWLRVFLSRKLRVTLQLFKGRWGTPIMPFKIPINVVMGKPLRVFLLLRCCSHNESALHFQSSVLTAQ